MRYLDFKSTIVEVAMNPTAYAQSMKQADEVKIGFEFEVCVPQYRIAAAPDIVKTVTAETVQDIITYNDMLISGGFNDYISPTVFDKLFKFKAPSKYSNMTEILDDLRKQALPKILKLFHEIPENKRVKAIEEAKQHMARSMAQRNRRDSWKSFGSKELYFAFLFGACLYEQHGYSGRNFDLTRIGLNIRGLADIKWADLLNAAFESENPSNEQNIQDNLTTYFTFDPDTVYNTLKLAEYEADDENYGDNDYGYDYLGAVKVLEPALKKTMNSEVTVFSSYHQKTKNMTSWYIEPDGSLNTVDYDDGAAEIVGPPQPAAQALETLAKFYSMAKKLHLYTNDSTGLHINISIPQNIDILKLAVFSGDQYVLQQFNRLDNDYAASVIRGLKTGNDWRDGITPRVANDEGLTKLRIKSIEDLAKSLTDRHTASITSNGKYISFRQVGGNYLNEYDQVLNVVGRFVRAIIIASDPNAYRKEYLAELGKLVMPTSDNNIDLQIDQLRKEGLKVTVGYMYVSSFSIGRSRAMKWETLIKNTFYHPREYSNTVTLLSLEKNSEEAKLKLSFTRSDISAAKQRQLQAADTKNFAKFVVPTDQILKSMSHLFDRVNTNSIGSEGQWERFTLTNTVLPSTDPIVQKLILSLRRQKLGK